MRKYLLSMVCVLIVAIILCGAASATSSYISTNGKTVSVKYTYSKSTLTDSFTSTYKDGTYGYGYYGVAKTTGKDIKGNTVKRTALYFNPDKNYFTFKNLKSGNFDKSKSDGSWSKDSMKIVSNSLMTETISGKTFNGLTYSGKAEFGLYYQNGQRLIKSGVLNMKYYKSGVLYATVYSTYTPSYRKIAGLLNTIKVNSYTRTTYANGDSRKSTINTNYNRDSKGILKGQITSGVSSGTEKVNGKTVTYTGKIKITTRSDTKDTWNEYYVNGDYSESRTSTSATLVRRIPLEAL